MTPEELERTLARLIRKQAELERRVKGIRDYRIPDMVSEYDIEDQVFRPMAKIRAANPQTFTTGVSATVLMDTTVFNTMGEGAADLANDRIVIQRDGTYAIFMTLIFNPSAGGVRRIITLDLNGANIEESNKTPIGGGVQVTTLELSVVRNLVTGDRLTLVALQDSGGNLDTATTYQSSSLSVVFLG